MTQLARRFLKSGHASGAEIAELASECSRIVHLEAQKSSSRAIQLGHDYVKYAQPHGNAVLQRAYRALGYACLIGGRFSQAEEVYLKARDLAKRDPRIRGEIDRALIDIYMYLGDFEEARRRARLSMAAFRKLDDTCEMAKTRVNYANILHRQDRHREARKLYRKARAVFEKEGSEVLSAYCYHNEANTLVQLFDFEEARKLYRQAEGMLAKNGYDLRAAGCRYGLAWLHMLEGNYHIALRELAECEGFYRAASQPREEVLCKLDRAEAYLGLNLFTDARRAAHGAERLATKLGIRYESAKAALFLAKACMAMGNITLARRALKRAQNGFRRENNSAFLAAAELTAVRIEGRIATRPERIRAARRRFSKAQLPLWEAICDLQILSEWPDDSGVLRRLAKNAAVRAVPHLYARWKTVLGDHDAEKGRLDSAIAHWTHACDVLDAVRAKLPPVDMRTAFLRNQGDPHCKMVRAELIRNPVAAAAWSERYKTAGLWQTTCRGLGDTPTRTETMQYLSELASQITVLSSGLEATSERHAGTSLRAAKAFEVLQENIRHSLARLEGSAGARVDRVESVIEQLGLTARQIPIIQFHTGGSDLIAFVHSGKHTHSHQYFDGARIAREFTSRWRFLIERAPFLTSGHRLSDLRDERQLLRQIGDWLLAPLEIPSGCRRLLILPEGDITNLPWQALNYNGQPLIANHEILLSPSLRHYQHACSHRTRSEKIEVFVGPTDDLPKSRRECDILLANRVGRVELHSPCYRGDWPNSGHARLWHYAGHAQLRADNPFYSSLSLADGPMFAADFRLKSSRVGLVTLAACRTGQQAYLPGEESTGLVRSLLEMGARSVLASHWAISDESTSLWMTQFYKLYLSGEPTLSAVRKTALSIQNRYASAYHWAAFSMFGAA